MNVGIVDPGWNGRLATALVKFSNTNFEIQRGEGFLRVLFIEHNITEAKAIIRDRDRYLSEIREKSAKVPSTFLDLKSLADEMTRQIYGSSIFANWLTRFGLVLAILAILATFTPIAYGVSSEYMSRKADVQKMQEEIKKVQDLQSKLQTEQRELQFQVDHLPIP